MLLWFVCTLSETTSESMFGYCKLLVNSLHFYSLLDAMHAR
jgi:hypothetical protein